MAQHPEIDDEPEPFESHEEWDNEDEDDDSEIIRAKWMMDGAGTLSDAARMLRSGADDLETLERQGWQLIDPVKDDYGYIRQEEK